MSGRKIIKGLQQAVDLSRGETTRVRERTVHVEDSSDEKNRPGSQP